MTAEQRAPLAAFFVLLLATAAILANALRTDAMSGLFVAPAQSVIAGARLIPVPARVISAEFAMVRHESTPAAEPVAPVVTDQVVTHMLAVRLATAIAPTAAEPRHPKPGAILQQPVQAITHTLDAVAGLTAGVITGTTSLVTSAAGGVVHSVVEPILPTLAPVITPAVTSVTGVVGSLGNPFAFGSPATAVPGVSSPSAPAIPRTAPSARRHHPAQAAGPWGRHRSALHPTPGVPTSVRHKPAHAPVHPGAGSSQAPAKPGRGAGSSPYVRGHGSGHRHGASQTHRAPQGDRAPRGVRAPHQTHAAPTSGAKPKPTAGPKPKPFRGYGRGYGR